MSTNQELIERAGRHLLQNYRQQPIVLEKGQGVWVWDVEGRRYLDLLGGIATCALGHCHPELVKVAKDQLDRLWHVSNVFYSRPQIELAEALTRAAGLERAFFCNSGAEANEAMLKLTRRVMKDRGHPERFEVLSFESSFHGRTLATVSATGQAKYQQGFEPLPEGFRHLPFGDLEAVKAALSPRTAAILVEPIQGEGGVRALPPGFLEALRALCDQEGLLLLVDEVQTGMGRTGRVFAFQHEGVLPDAISVAKALGNGLPIAAMLCREQVGSSLPVGSHGSTFGGNPVAAAVATSALAILSAPAFLEQVAAKGEHFLAGARELQARMPDQVAAVRGRGLLMGIELKTDAAAQVARCRENGLLVNLAGPKTVRFAPPLMVTQAELDEGLKAFERALVASAV